MAEDMMVKENFVANKEGEEEHDGLVNESNCRAPCQQCGLNPFKYKCPGCGFRSCGLACVKAHKELTACTGKRNRTAFVPISQYDDNLLISDYNLLEEILRQADSAKRTRVSLGCYRQQLNSRWSALKNQATRRKTTLLFLAKGMTRRKANSSLYCNRRKCIFWRIEWIFHSTEVRLVDARVDENVRLIDVLKEKMAASPGNAVTRHQLRQFCKESINGLRLLLVKEPHLGVQKHFIELDPKKQLGLQLVNKTIIEFLTIYVVLPNDTNNLNIIENLRSVDCVKDEPKGTLYREEEIEEGEIEEGEIEEGEIF